MTYKEQMFIWTIVLEAGMHESMEAASLGPLVRAFFLCHQMVGKVTWYDRAIVQVQSSLLIEAMMPWFYSHDFPKALGTYIITI